MKITFKDLEEASCGSVTDYCRLLVSENKKDYSDEKILVYRDEMLCLTVNDIYLAATLQPTGSGWTKFDGRRGKGPVEARGEV